ncbi:MAG: 2-amino-4-hydroxy-6-hydroxymethyldihydropteridine diphosphokinase [Bacteroidales bacterium]|nr:2-amino-4-hydroxy-6-hydroxymethyldihydropteridine diphosphokinase [Bacteroidales bacterium]
MAAEKVYFSLGSNLGDRQRNLERALELMDAAFGCHYLRVSPFLETEAWGFEGEPFLNCAVVYALEDKPERVLRRCKRIERRMGRRGRPEYDAEGKRTYRSRIIDIDILLYGDRTVDTPELAIPHPRMGERAFVQDTLKFIKD